MRTLLLHRRRRATVMAVAATVMLVGVAIAQASVAVRPGSYAGSAKPTFLDTGSGGKIKVAFKVAGHKVSAVDVAVTGLCGGLNGTVHIAFANAKISGRGTFRSAGQYGHEFEVPGTPYLKLTMTGTFAANGREHGELTYTSFGPPGCSGTTTYSTKH